MNTENYLAIDIGGTWLKGILIKVEENMPFASIPELVKQAPVVRVKSRLSAEAMCSDFINALDELLSGVLSAGEKLSGISISTAGIVNYHGSKVLLAAPHLKALTDSYWIEYLKGKTNVPVVLANDADAASIGAASLGYLHGHQTIGIMPVGTGLGFTVWRNGRKWTPHFSMTLLGCTYTPLGSYDLLSSASGLSSADSNGDLIAVFTKEEYKKARNNYIQDLSGIISSAHILYGLDKVLIGGGLAEAAVCSSFPLTDRIKKELQKNPILTSDKVEVEILTEGNMLPLIGATLLAIGEEKAQSLKLKKNYSEIHTEVPYDNSLWLDKMPTESLLELFWNAEQESGVALKKSLPIIREVVDTIVEKLSKGGRLLYVGSGTSGRLAAIDNVELGCTFGFPRERVLTFISGGVADASMEIEYQFEEDASAVPELLLVNITPLDVVIGISVSGSAYYVQSGLGFSKSIGAFTVMIQEEEVKSLPFCHKVISLQSGNEVLAGSTRMKAGTATKKVLNFISTSTMIRLGKVHGCYMTEMECINEKLVERAQHILQTLYGLDKGQSLNLLKENDFILHRAIKNIK